MDFNMFEKALLERREENGSAKMAAYMRNKFKFLGIPAPLRKPIFKEFISNLKKEGGINWDVIDLCWKNEFREFHYFVVDYLATMKKRLVYDDIFKIKELIVTNSWWDTVDGLDRVAGEISFRFHEAKEILLKWSLDNNFWLRRAAIDHQLLRKDDTDTDLLEKIIVNNLYQKEFFINKAIGWALRDFSKSNSEWVRNFIEKYHEGLSDLSIREASKYI